MSMYRPLPNTMAWLNCGAPQGQTGEVCTGIVWGGPGGAFRSCGACGTGKSPGVKCWCPQHCGPGCITTRQSEVHHRDGELMRAPRTPGPTGARGSPVTGRRKCPLRRRRVAGGQEEGGEGVMGPRSFDNGTRREHTRACRRIRAPHPPSHHPQTHTHWHWPYAA
jgi:hypothetical protein